jgi:8-oxo-dGTP pyrophosphatase MutT (NUDIX family)
MEYLATIYPEQVDPTALPQDYAGYKDRQAGRAIIFDGDQVALVYVKKSGYFMLPGGGLDGDDIRTGLAREVLEETGLHIDILERVGSIAVYFDRWRQRQIDQCFITRVVGRGQEVRLTDFETEEGYELIWVPTIQEAIARSERMVPAARDARLVRARDLLFLRTAARQVSS